MKATRPLLAALSATAIVSATLAACESAREVAEPRTSGGAGGATANGTTSSGGFGGQNANDDGLPEDEPDDLAVSSSTGSMLEGATPPDLPPDHPGGWAQSTLVFAQAKMLLDEQDNDRVQLGWTELDASKVGVACGAEGPKATRTFYSWTHTNYAAGDCTQDKKNYVDFARWDHAGSELVDGCPGKAEWVKDGMPATVPFLSNCPPHVTSGYGDPAARKSVDGRYEYDAIGRTLVFAFEANGTCRKEYFRDLTIDPSGKLLGAVLDGAKTGDTSNQHHGFANTHGYAFLSPIPIASAATFTATTEALRTRSFLADGLRFRESRKMNPPQPEHYQKNSALGFSPADCKASVAFDHSCVGADPGQPPFLAECAESPTKKTAYLRWLVTPFAKSSPREHLYWAWHAHHAPNWTGCYHRGSHSNPALQIVDADGIFRGYVGIEMQRAAGTLELPDGSFIDDPDNYLNTDYRVWRWIEAGFEPILSP